MYRVILFVLMGLGLIVGCGGGGGDTNVGLNVDDTVVATSQSIIAKENNDKKITLTGTKTDTVSYHIITKPKKGKLKGIAPNLTYIPNKDYFGVDSFTFKVSDGNQDSATATINLTIKAYRKLTETGGKYNYSWTYDKYGNILTKSRDHTLVEDHRYTYDEDGNVLIAAADYDNDDDFDNNYNGTHFADGVIDNIVTYTYDKHGNELTRSYDHNADGVEDQLYTYSYNKYGDKLLEIGPFTKSTWTYDEDRNMLTYYHNGYLDTWTYDKHGNVLSLIENNRESDVSTSTYNYTYDTNGNMLTRSNDIKVLDTWTYDINGNMLTSNHLDINIHTYTYDENGNILTDDYSSNGISDFKGIHTYTYDENGNILTDIDQEADGRVNLRAYTWEEVIAN